jgi:thioredoxin reductase
MELSKEDLLSLWNTVLQRADFRVRTNEPVEDVLKGLDGTFTVMTGKGQYRAKAVVLALGRTGTPRKLGVKGEELPKVMYRLIEADHYVNKNILVVGGGDSAVEAAMGLGLQKGNRVTLSYRKSSFSRIKERNAQRIQEYIHTGKVHATFNSAPVEIRPESVVLDIQGKLQEVPNDFVWIFAGGITPKGFLERIGVEFRMLDMTLEASQEAQHAAMLKKQLAQVS